MNFCKTAVWSILGPNVEAEWLFIVIVQVNYDNLSLKNYVTQIGNLFV